ncbi:hypothetical protein [Terasakiella pusilla]|uniref:hypothetical protein n=1 Tax=Terasakiella pusilla TaxID=64973 RepID=UPI003AA8C8E3
MKTPLLSLLFALALHSTASAQSPLVEETPFGKTDWQGGYVEATGQGTSRYMGNRIQEELMAKQAARTTAQARLLELVKGVRLTGLSTLGAEAQGDTRAATRIKGTLQGARTVTETVTWHKDESSRRGEVVFAEVTLRLCTQPTCTETTQNLTTASLTPPVTPHESPKPAAPEAINGLIIDLDNALYLPALSPSIINEDGTVLYSQDTVPAATAREKGLIHYTKTVEQARKLAISGDSPLVLSAQRITKDNRIVLSNADGERFVETQAAHQGRVIVALD